MSTSQELSQDRQYLMLVRRFPLRPIRSGADLDRAVAMVDSLLDRGELNPDEADYLEVLADLIEKYESAEHPPSHLPAGAMLEHLMEARSLSRSQLAAESGLEEATISAILSGTQSPDRDLIVGLSRYFQVSPAVFLAD